MPSLRKNCPRKPPAIAYSSSPRKLGAHEAEDNPGGFSPALSSTAASPDDLPAGLTPHHNFLGTGATSGGPAAHAPPQQAQVVVETDGVTAVAAAMSPLAGCSSSRGSSRSTPTRSADGSAHSMLPDFDTALGVGNSQSTIDAKSTASSSFAAHSVAERRSGTAGAPLHQHPHPHPHQQPPQQQSQQVPLHPSFTPSPPSAPAASTYLGLGVNGSCFGLPTTAASPPVPSSRQLVPGGFGGGFGGGNAGMLVGAAPPSPGRANSAATKAVLSALRALQEKARRLEDDNARVARDCERLRERIAVAEEEASRALDEGFESARLRSREASAALERRALDRRGLVDNVAAMRAARERLVERLSAARARASDLALSRRTAEARCESHTERAAEARRGLELAEARGRDAAAAAAASEAAASAACAGHEARLAAAEAARAAELRAAKQAAAKLASAEEMLGNVVGIVEHLVRSSAGTKGTAGSGGGGGGGASGGSRGRDSAAAGGKASTTFASSRGSSLTACRGFLCRGDPGDGGGGDLCCGDPAATTDPHYTIATSASERAAADSEGNVGRKRRPKKSPSRKNSVRVTSTTRCAHTLL